jgi:DNA-binding XRE family transcriptional regulator
MSEAMPGASVAELMKEWRNVARLNTTQAGEHLGLSSRTIEDIEQGRSRAGDVLAQYGLYYLIIEALKDDKK